VSLYRNLVLLAGVVVGSGCLIAAPFSNGGLAPATTIPPAGYLLINSGNDSTSLTSWTINNVDLISTYWQAPPGASYSVDLNGLSGGLMWQTFDTVAGHIYSVSYYFSGNPDSPLNGSPLRQANVGVNDGDISGGTFLAGPNSIPAGANLDVTVLGPSKANMLWQQQTFTFTALSSSATLIFRGNLSQSSGIAIGGVGVVDLVPEPATFVIAATGLLLLGLGRLRRA